MRARTGRYFPLKNGWGLAVPLPPQLENNQANQKRIAAPRWAFACISTIIRAAFSPMQVPEYTPHAFRKTLTHYGNEVYKTPDAFKAWSMNPGHENVATTISSTARHDRTADGIDPRNGAVIPRKKEAAEAGFSPRDVRGVSDEYD